MKRFISYITKNLKFITAILLASLVGGLTTNLVRASVPDSSGVIHACRNDLRESVSIIDTDNSESCGTGETALSWNNGPQVDYIYLDSSADLNTTDSQGVLAHAVIDGGLCLNMNFSPRIGIPDGSPGYPSIALASDPYTSSTLSDVCGSGYNVMVPISNFTGSATEIAFFK